MTNKEAARTLLYGLSRETSKDTYLDAICLAICALMREEQHGNHEENECVWHDAKTDPPKKSGRYFVIREDNPEHLVAVRYWLERNEWMDSDCCFINDVVEWKEYVDFQ